MKPSAGRRRFLKSLLLPLLATMPGLVRSQGVGGRAGLIHRTIPSSGEKIPVIGMGTWLTFNDDSESSRQNLKQVLATFFTAGGRLIDTSPMYGNAERLLGELLPGVPGHERIFSATKVWTLGREHGLLQMQDSFDLLGMQSLDLMQVHNLLDWRVHIKSLRQMKEEGRIRYIGVTTSHGRRHEELEKIMRSEPLDFVQFTLNLNNLASEQRLLPLAADRGIATIINRPFQGGELFNSVRNRALPAWASEYGIHHWSQFMLKYIISHPYVSCTIPATSQVPHMVENMAAAVGELPTAAVRSRMRSLFADL